jgi:hypothetical protein
MNEIWKKIMSFKNKETRVVNGVQNTLKRDELSIIYASMEFWGANELFLKQTMFDLSIPKFRVFDYLAMCICGRCTGYPGGGDENNKTAIKVLAHAYIKANGDIDKWIQILREEDFDIDHSWGSITF